ncbi:MAG: hypothetical protein IKQ35_04660 [Bacilli bacterium]|nr:hypothetical protein [Bacilli bacterium]
MDIVLNDQGSIIYYDPITQKLTAKSSDLGFLLDFIDIDSVNPGNIIGKIGNMVVFTISNGRVTTNPITTTELRVLSVYHEYYRQLYQGTGHIDLIKFYQAIEGEIKEKYPSIYERIIKRQSDIERFLRREWDSEQKIHTELHTHFIEILNPDELEVFAKRYGINITPEFKLSMSIKRDEIVHFAELTAANNQRRELMSQCAEAHVRSMPEDDPDRLFFETYDDLKIAAKDVQQIFRKYGRQYFAGDTEGFKEKVTEELKKMYEEKRISALGRNLLLLMLQKIEPYKKGDSSSALYMPFNNWKEELIGILNPLNSNEQTHKKSEILDAINAKRTEILIKHLEKHVYLDYFERCLEKFEREGVHYSEISFSNFVTLQAIAAKYPNDPRFNLLYSINRTDSIDAFHALVQGDIEATDPLYGFSADKLLSYLKSGKIVGVDIMGNEKDDTPLEVTPFTDKMALILPVLHMFPNSVLRIHAGEYVEATDNVLLTLLAIKSAIELINKKCEGMFGDEPIKIPPPTIRIGHGVNIRECPELVDLLKEMHAVVEVNISSNMALSNISALKDVPLDFYRENGIPVVLSTDGGGMYLSSLLQEQNLADDRDGSSKGGDIGPGDSGDKGSDRGSSDGDSSLGWVIKSEGDYLAKHATKVGAITPEALARYKRIRDTIEPEIRKRTARPKPKSFVEAIKEEDRLYGTSSEKEKVRIEIDRIARYEHDRTYDEKSMIAMEVLKIASDLYDEGSIKSIAIAKRLLFLLESKVYGSIEITLVTEQFVEDEINSNSSNRLDELRNIDIKRFVETEEDYNLLAPPSKPSFSNNNIKGFIEKYYNLIFGKESHFENILENRDVLEPVLRLLSRTVETNDTANELFKEIVQTKTKTTDGDLGNKTK